jgi:hypothetical protein
VKSVVKNGIATLSIFPFRVSEYLGEKSFRLISCFLQRISALHICHHSFFHSGHETAIGDCVLIGSDRETEFFKNDSVFIRCVTFSLGDAH